MRASHTRRHSGVFGLVSNLIDAMKAAVSHRRIVGHLAGLDDHLLRDIGLTRFDVDAVAGGSYRNDPTIRLARLARDARSGRREAAREQLQWARLLSEAEGFPKAESDRRAA